MQCKLVEKMKFHSNQGHGSRSQKSWASYDGILPLKKNYWSESLQMPFNGSIVNVIHDQIPKLTLNFCDLDSWQQQKEMKW